MKSLVEVEGLHVTGRDDAGRDFDIVKDVSLAIAPGEVLALIGESGSGKSTIALALMGYARPGCRVTGGRITIAGRDLATLGAVDRARLRGQSIAYVAQSAAAAFNPARTVLSQIVEGARIHKTLTVAEAERRAIALFHELSLPDPERIGARYPHQVSGGQLQRLMLAMALVMEPQIVILDEPTTALDVTTQIDVLKAFKKVVRERQTTVLYVSHDLAVVAQMADRIVVLRRGEIQEAGQTASMLAAPQHAYTQSLLAAAVPAVPAERTAAVAVSPPPLLEMHGLYAGYGAVGRDGTPAFPVLRNIDLVMQTGTSVGVIGESGSGKSTLARVIAGLLPAARGSINLEGRRLAPRARDRSVTDLRDIQIVFQMADTALNPAHSIGRILARPVWQFYGLRGDALKRRVAELLDMVRLPAGFAERMPRELSGGQKQRVNLARALAAKPKLILCDEVTSGLDTVVGAAILRLLADLRRDLHISYLFISHDLSTVRAVCDEVMILYAGQRVESASQKAIRIPPFHPYADLLISSIPELKIGWLEKLAPRRDVEAASGLRPTTGCAFAARCSLAIPGTCAERPPPERLLANGASILCHCPEADLLAAQQSTLAPAIS
ncbi:MAG: ABC transporter ATP-binding protein [Hyphomicrobiaceae bacterium]